MAEWVLIALPVLSITIVLQQLLLFRIRRESKKKEEIFQVVTENAADMIALVDVKGHRCTTVLPTNESSDIHPPNSARPPHSNRFILMIDSAFSMQHAKRAKAESVSSSNTASSTRTEAGAFSNRLPARFAIRKVMSQSWSS